MNVFVKEYDRKAEAIVTNAILMPAGEVREDCPLPHMCIRKMRHGTLAHRSLSFRLALLSRLASCPAAKASSWE